ncbi:ubiquinol-cytochrome c reductase complex 7.3 kda protein-like protein [Lineolata rhizophorae]|uniref:Complex III subunit 9 n=1 Tax=Lineolata rhizophorae TaxID=578093 RepID=A0A6A6P1X2_9PEZI|nr:ubiquinol-cytochrome c reductase complex 7.3 kda protein-like protein [Lineolata rhizophorae]
MAGVLSTLYQGLVRTNTRYLAVIFGSAFAIQLSFDKGSDKLWDTLNSGRQWKDIKYRYMEKDEEEEE